VETFNSQTKEVRKLMFIVVKFETKPEWTQRWPALVGPFPDATRAEEGNLWFEWWQGLDNPAEYVLLEAFRDDTPALYISTVTISTPRFMSCGRH
jgi:quinol monooxygenase YgiN